MYNSILFWVKENFINDGGLVALGCYIIARLIFIYFSYICGYYKGKNFKQAFKLTAPIFIPCIGFMFIWMTALELGLIGIADSLSGDENPKPESEVLDFIMNDKD